MDASIQKWGNSLALRIPINYAKDINLKKGSHVDLIKEDNKIIIIPKKHNLKLKDLLSKINDTNIHDEVNTGDQVGKEAW